MSLVLRDFGRGGALNTLLLLSDTGDGSVLDRMCCRFDLAIVVFVVDGSTLVFNSAAATQKVSKSCEKKVQFITKHDEFDQ